MSQDLDLRPIPGPEAVELAKLGWWVWLVPIVLMGFLCYWWLLRKTKKTAHTGQDRLYLALASAEEPGVDPRLRYQELHHALREYLTCLDPAWKTLTVDDSFPHWKKLFPEQVELAEQWHAQWLAAEAIVFGPVAVSEDQVTDYARRINELDLEFSERNEKLLKPLRS